ncbi:MAG TPA: hypothetical protein VE268_01115, partial [Herpetosiphonaceae bacterium]|nr:hypothetical protein [Herpetosiphonaceae bacterium]
ARKLVAMKSPELVFFVHGFNNPEETVLRQVVQTHQVIVADPAINQRDVVFIGYRWPSERMLSIGRTTLRAAPDTVRALIGFWFVLLVIGIVLGARLALIHHSWGAPDEIAFVIWSVLFPFIFAMPAGPAILRAVVYFRDGYRATNYGVPDFVDFIRDLDAQLTACAGQNAAPCVRLSFIAHSMGSLVVTNIVRILSNAFGFAVPQAATERAAAGEQPDLNSQAANDRNSPTPGDIGQHFRLGRLVLASPDIPNETLMSSRNNFLKSSLRRFEEAYLFSNEGDEVLHLVSTLANYFSFPTSQHNYGYRLGNVAVHSELKEGKPEYGIINLPELEALGSLDIRSLSPDALQDLIQKLERHTRWVAERLCFDRISLYDYRARRAISRTASLPNHKPKATTASHLSQATDSESIIDPLEVMQFHMYFTYFDCTDYRDVKECLVNDQSGTNGHLEETSPARGLLTRAKRKPILRWWDHVLLLIQYVTGIPYDLNVHGGYFEGCESQRLIYRLACLGWTGLLDTVIKEAKSKDSNTPSDDPRQQAMRILSNTCCDHGIQVLLSPKHYASARAKDPVS